MMRWMHTKFNNVAIIMVAAIVGTLTWSAVGRAATVAPSSLQPMGKVSLTFDDGLRSAYTNAAPILATYGFTGTDYIPTACIGSTGTCPANESANYMTWAQVTALQSKYGWEIGAHTVDHPCLASDTQPDCPNTSILTPAQVSQELTQSKQTLASHGINATAFASPFGDYNNAVLAQIAQNYTSHRGFADIGYNQFPYNDYLLYDQQVTGGVSVAQVESYINHAVANNQWLVLTFHDIKLRPSTNPGDYEWGTAQLTQIASYLKLKNVPVVNVSQGLVTSNNDLLPNSNFANGISDGWTTDAPATITADTNIHGNFPQPADSIKMVSTSADTHLFSPKVTVNPTSTYIIKNFLNVQATSGGAIGFYIDEYDANGNWVSGQWRTQEPSAFVENLNFVYTPSSPRVVQARLQVVVTGTPGTTAYLDNSQWFLSTISAATHTNLLPNGTFDAGIADGWSTDDPTDIKADANNNGSPANPVNSVYLQSSTTTTNGHLFSPVIGVNPAQTYNITSWLNLKQISNTTSGEVALYIDEYDANGNWISGQYKGGVHTLGATTLGTTYVPTSSIVSKARVQIIVVGNAGIQAYFDDAQWYAVN